MSRQGCRLRVASGTFFAVSLSSLPFLHHPMPAPWIYSTGDTVRIGDVVSLGHWPGVVVELVTEAHPDWNPTTGEGVLFEGPDFGRLLTQDLGNDVRLIRRAPAA